MTQSPGASSTQVVEESTARTTEASARTAEPSPHPAESSARDTAAPSGPAVEWYELTPIEAARPAPPPPGPLTPAQAFEALYAFCSPTLVRQTYLLTGRSALARKSVEHAFQLAWQHWPEVAVDPDPAGWVRAAAHEYALSPWHRLRPRLPRPTRQRRSRSSAPPAQKGRAVSDRVLIGVLLELPPPYRRALLLYDGVGLDLPETAAETEASTPATAGRLMYAREAVAARLPGLADPGELHRRLAEAVNGEHQWVVRPCAPATARVRGERRARRWTHAAATFTVLLLSATALTLRTAPDRYRPPVVPGTPVQGVPPRAAMGSPSQDRLEFKAERRSAPERGPERLAPETR